jgi:hypothetical protein
MTTQHDSQKSGMAGEFLVAGKLFKLGYQVSVTMGNAKAIDLFVHNNRTDRTFNVQVKTLRKKNCFPLRKEDINPNDIYVFVILNGPDQNEDYFIISGDTILANITTFFGMSYAKKTPSNMPAVNYGPLKEFRDKWEIFDQR